MTTGNFWFYLKNKLIQTSQTGGQWYSDTSPFSIPCFNPLQASKKEWIRLDQGLINVIFFAGAKKAGVFFGGKFYLVSLLFV